MSDDAVNYSTVRSFWATKSTDSDNRWTDDAILAFEQEMLSELADRATLVLDLGSGHGALSRSLVGAYKRLVAVDAEAGYEESFRSPNHDFYAMAATEFDCSQRFDLVLAMGLVTYLNSPEERRLYEVCSRLVTEKGRVVVKNQCGREREVIVNHFSKDLGLPYSARYPFWEDQVATLGEFFTNVDITSYPEEFNRWEDTFHVAFSCSR